MSAIENEQRKVYCKRNLYFNMNWIFIHSVNGKEETMGVSSVLKQIFRLCRRANATEETKYHLRKSQVTFGETSYVTWVDVIHIDKTSCVFFLEYYASDFSLTVAFFFFHHLNMSSESNVSWQIDHSPRSLLWSCTHINFHSYRRQRRRQSSRWSW